jgi:hypothetical protein
MFLNQLFFFGLCLNPICLIAATPHVLIITLVLGTWLYMPKWRKLKEKLLFEPETYIEIETRVQKHKENKNKNKKIFTGNIHLIVTQNRSKGEEDFHTILTRFMKPKISSIIRLDNQYKSKALLVALKSFQHLFMPGDIIAIVRGGGDINEPQFDPYKDSETCHEIRNLRDNYGIIVISGIGHASDRFLIEQCVDFAQITPTDAALQATYLINGGKW